jgi:putative transposase
VRYGYRQLHILLRREDWPLNHNRTYRFYCKDGIAIRPKEPKRKRAWRHRHSWWSVADSVVRGDVQVSLLN